MEYTIYNYFNQNDTNGEKKVLKFKNFKSEVGKNVVIHKSTTIIGDSNKITHIGNDTYIGPNVTIVSGIKIGDRNIILSNSSLDSDSQPNEIFSPNKTKLSFEGLVKEIVKNKLYDSEKVNISLVADDYGRNHNSNVGINFFLKNLLLNHASLMVNRNEYTDEAIDYIKANRLEDKIGLHFNMTEVKNLYSVNDPKNIANKITNQKRTFFFLKAKEKNIIQNELKNQIHLFENYNIPLTYFDSHGHIHLRLSTAKLIAPFFKNTKTIVRPPLKYSNKRLFLLPLSALLKRRIRKIYNNKVLGPIYFISARDLFRIKKSQKGKIVEVMLHPFLSDNQIINRRDIDFTCIVGFLFDNQDKFCII